MEVLDIGEADEDAAFTAFLKIKGANLSTEEATAELLKSVPELLAANKCPDFIEDKGHYYGTQLPNEDKLALIEYLKTF